LYSDSGISVLPWPDVIPFDHCTGAYCSLREPSTWRPFLGAALHWRRSARRTIELINHVKPALVHLNSMALSPCATALCDEGIPFVWHVRESPATGVFGLRRNLISRLLETHGDEVIFLSGDDRQAWVKNKRGIVIENFVSDGSLQIDQEQARAELDLDRTAAVICYVGGLYPLKGIFPLLDALAILRLSFPNIVCLMPGSQYTPSGRWQSRVARSLLPLFGSGTLAQRVEERIRCLGLTKTCTLAGFQRNIGTWISASDLMVFPSLAPHFARPVIEAAFGGRPSVASNLAGVAGLVEHGSTGLLVEPGNPQVLAKACARLLGDQELRAKMGARAMSLARQRFSAAAGVRKIEAIYDRILDRGPLLTRAH
jgi:glycosyltransferase involved in cell wall biosynthesis